MSEPGQDLVLPPSPGARSGLVIPAGELVERFSRAGGPGGQGVNTTDSRVELLFDPRSSSAFSPAQRARVLRALAARLGPSGLSIVGSEYRSQLRNRAAVRARLVDLLTEALAPAAPTRRPTRPTRGSQVRRLDTKKRRSQVKAGRRRVPPTD